MSKEREEFIARFAVEFTAPAHTLMECLDAARALLRLARTHGNLAVAECNGPQWGAGRYTLAREVQAADQDRWETRLSRQQERCEAKIRALCEQFTLPVTLGGDPRGYTVKVKLPSGAYNTWGGLEEGYGVPQ